MITMISSVKHFKFIFSEFLHINDCYYEWIENVRRGGQARIDETLFRGWNLIDKFDWSRTEQGRDFWCKMHYRWMEFIEGKKLSRLSEPVNVHRFDRLPPQFQQSPTYFVPRGSSYTIDTVSIGETTVTTFSGSITDGAAPPFPYIGGIEYV